LFGTIFKSCGRRYRAMNNEQCIMNNGKGREKAMERRGEREQRRKGEKENG